jgi:hypothetical protein
VEDGGSCYEAGCVSVRKYEGFQDLEIRAGVCALFAQCPWRTVFAHPDFLEAWYRSRPDLAPMVSVSFENGSVDGQVAFACDADRVMFAGGDDVPVHGWLAPPLRGSWVLERHLAELGAERISFHLPPGAPTDWLGEARALGRVAHATPRKRRVFRFDRARSSQKLDEKKNTSQAPHVKALGTLALKEARREDFSTYLGWHRQKRHVRGLQAGLQNRRLDLYRGLSPEILSATVLVAGDAVLSSMLVYRDGSRAWLELLAENPEHERHSPGILHLYLLEERWIEQVSEIDVTADDDYLHLIADESEFLSVDLLFNRRARLGRMASDALARIVYKR